MNQPMPYRILFTRFSFLLYAIVAVVGITAIMVTATIRNPGPGGNSTATLTSIFGFSTMILMQLLNSLRGELAMAKGDEAREHIKKKLDSTETKAEAAKQSVADVKEVVQQVERKLDHNTQLTVQSIAANDFKQREADLMSMFAKILSPAEKAQAQEAADALRDEKEPGR